MLLRSMQKIHEGVSRAAAGAMLAHDVAGRRRLHIKAVCQSVREATTPPAIMQPPDQTPLNGIICPSERLITMQKQLEGTQKYINEQCR